MASNQTADASQTGATPAAESATITRQLTAKQQVILNEVSLVLTTFTACFSFEIAAAWLTRRRKEVS
jgi:hypothetical protein